MAHSKAERAVAFAGVLQAAHLVSLVSQRQPYSQSAFDASIDSILVTSPENTLAVFADKLGNVQTGLKQLSELNKKDEMLMRYTISLLAVEKQLSKRPDILATIGRRLQHMQHQIHDDDATSRLQRLSGVYQDTVSTLPFRIQVIGDRDYLTQAHISDKIRSLLFAGVRSAMLWRQVGGNKWQLIFGRGALEKQAKYLIQQISSQ